MMLCVMMLPLVVVGCTSKKQSVSQCVKPPPPAAWIMQPHPDWQTPLNRIIISPSEGSVTMQKQLEGASILMSSADRVAHIDGLTHAIIIEAIHTRFSGYKY